MDELVQNEKSQIPPPPASSVDQSSNTQPIQPNESTTPPKPPPPPPWRVHSPHSLLGGHEPLKNSQNKYASFFTRFLASFIDSFIVTAVSGGITYAIIFISGSLVNSYGGMDGAITTSIAQIPAILLGPAYFIYFTGSSGQTLGKKIVKIKVVKKSSTAPPSYTSAFLREVVGKMISAVVLGLGYLWVIGDKEKQAWHDKIAGTVVIRVNNV